MTFYHNPGNTKPLPVLYVWLSEDEAGNEGIMGDPFPLITGERELAERMRPLAERAGKKVGIKVKLVRYMREQ